MAKRNQKLRERAEREKNKGKGAADRLLAQQQEEIYFQVTSEVRSEYPTAEFFAGFQENDKEWVKRQIEKEQQYRHNWFEREQENRHEFNSDLHSGFHWRNVMGLAINGALSVLLIAGGIWLLYNEKKVDGFVSIGVAISILFGAAYFKRAGEKDAVEAAEKAKHEQENKPTER